MKEIRRNEARCSWSQEINLSSAVGVISSFSFIALMVRREANTCSWEYEEK